MTALDTVGDALALIAEYESLPPRERNYRSCIWAGNLAACLGNMAVASGRAAAEAFDNGKDHFAAGLGELIADMRGGGDSEILRAVIDVLVNQLENGGEPPAEWFGVTR